MKVVIVTQYPELRGAVNGGVASVAEILVQALNKLENVNVEVIGISESGKTGVENRDGVNIHWIKIFRPAFLRYWNKQRCLIHEKLEELNPDITHFQDVAGWTIRYNKPYVLTIHGINEKDVLHTKLPFRYLRAEIVRLVEGFARRTTKNIIIINSYVLDEIGKDITGCQYFIENPVGDEYFDVANHNVVPTVLCVARVMKRKNIDGLIRAFKYVNDVIPGAVLEVVGPADDTDYLESCYALIKKYQLENSVIFRGALDRGNVLQCLSTSSCFALVSWQETAPVVIAEAMAAGLPVVASKICGIPNMIDEGETGWLVDPTNEIQIAEKIIAAIQMKSVNREIVYKRFNSRFIAEQTLLVYQTILCKKKQR